MNTILAIGIYGNLIIWGSIAVWAGVAFCRHVLRLWDWDEDDLIEDWTDTQLVRREMFR